MTPPLAYPVADVWALDALLEPADPAEHAFVLAKAETLRDTELAMKAKPVGPDDDLHLVHELKQAGPRGAVRIYFTIHASDVFVLSWGHKHGQDADISAACKAARVVRANPAKYRNKNNWLAGGSRPA